MSSAPFRSSNIRTAGFFKVREINIDHSGCEDFIFGNGELTDLKTEVINAGDLDEGAIAIEVFLRNP